MTTASAIETQILRDCYEEVRDALGPGYVQDYYLSFATGFVQIALAWYRKGVEDGRAER